MLANITASQCLVGRMAQLQAQGKLTDAHAALAKAFTTAKCRETVAWAREFLGATASPPSTTWGVSSRMRKPSTPTRARARCKI